MDTGKEDKSIRVEPIEDPFKIDRPVEQPAKTPLPITIPQKVPAGK